MPPVDVPGAKPLLRGQLVLDLEAGPDLAEIDVGGTGVMDLRDAKESSDTKQGE